MDLDRATHFLVP